MILVGPVLEATDFADPRLYALGLQPSVSQGQARRGERMTRVVLASDHAWGAPTAAVRDTGLASAGTFQ
jgi:hypothetical protein